MFITIAMVESHQYDFVLCYDFKYC